MKQRYNFKTLLMLIGICVGGWTTSCTENFDDYNTHATNPSPLDMTKAEKVGTLFPGILYLMHTAQENDNQMIEQMVGNQYGGYMATTNNWEGTNFGTFNPPANWIEYPFNKLFSGFYANYFKIKEITESRGYIYAWANIVRVAVMLRVTDTYGPIPYSKMGEGKLTVEYDDVQTVYHSMIDDLNHSIDALTIFVAENSGKTNPMGEFDPVYSGDFSKWIKFANSLKLRMAVRIAAVDEAYAKDVMAEAIAGGPIEANADNAFLPTTDNPYCKAAFDWKEIAVNAMLTSYMNGYNDPRREVYMTKTVNGTYLGVRMGIENIDKGVYSSATYSKPNFEANSPLLVYCAAETKFLKAEAALQGWIPGGDASASNYYYEGIATSLEQHGVPDNINYMGVPSLYYSDPATGGSEPYLWIYPITVDWDNTDVVANQKLAKIITQKWIANYPLGFEAWCDLRRTGYPQMYQAKNNLSSENSMGTINNNRNNPSVYASRLVRRLPYPVSEYNGNRANVEAAVANMLGGPDKGYVDLWWAKK
jgi:hypothetical protein